VPCSVFFLTFGLLQQIGFSFTPLHAALTGLPVAVGIAGTMAIAGEKIIPKFGRYSLSFGCTIMAIGLLTTDVVARHYLLNVHSWQLVPGLLCVGIGMGFVFGSLFAAVLNGVDSSYAGSASGTLNAVQQVGGAIGIALVGIIFFGQLSHSAAGSFFSIEPGLRHNLTVQQVPPLAQKYIISSSKQCFVDRSKEKDSSIVPASCKSIVSNSSSEAHALTQTVSQAARSANATNFAAAFHWAMLYSVCLLSLTFVLTMFLPRHFRTQADVVV
jgi:hypothetical protein